MCHLWHSWVSCCACGCACAGRSMAPAWGGCRKCRPKVALATPPRLNLPDTMHNQPARLLVAALLQAYGDRRQLSNADLGQLVLFCEEKTLWPARAGLPPSTGQWGGAREECMFGRCPAMSLHAGAL